MVVIFLVKKEGGFEGTGRRGGWIHVLCFVPSLFISYLFLLSHSPSPLLYTALFVRKTKVCVCYRTSMNPRLFALFFLYSLCLSLLVSLVQDTSNT